MVFIIFMINYTFASNLCFVRLCCPFSRVRELLKVLNEVQEVKRVTGCQLCKMVQASLQTKCYPLQIDEK